MGLFDSLGISSTTASAGLGAAGDLIGGFGSLIAGDATAAADRAKAKGFQEESLAYTQAAGYAAGEVNLAEESKAIKKYQQQLLINRTIGAQEAQVGGGGFQESGSGLSLLKASMAQGALATGLVGVQGEINAEGYRAQQAADAGLANQADTAAAAARSAASSASEGGIFGALGGVLGGAAKILPLIPGL